jgi:hypothetical protein
MYDIPLKTRFDEHVSSLSAPTWLLEMIYPEYISPMLPPLRDYPKEPILASRERIQSDFENKFPLFGKNSEKNPQNQNFSPFQLSYHLPPVLNPFLVQCSNAIFRQLVNMVCDPVVVCRPRWSPKNVFSGYMSLNIEQIAHLYTHIPPRYPLVQYPHGLDINQLQRHFIRFFSWDIFPTQTIARWKQAGSKYFQSILQAAIMVATIQYDNFVPWSPNNVIRQDLLKESIETVQNTLSRCDIIAASEEGLGVGSDTQMGRFGGEFKGDGDVNDDGSDVDDSGVDDDDDDDDDDDNGCKDQDQKDDNAGDDGDDNDNQDADNDEKAYHKKAMGEISEKFSIIPRNKKREKNSKTLSTYSLDILLGHFHTLEISKFFQEYNPETSIITLYNPNNYNESIQYVPPYWLVDFLHSFIQTLLQLSQLSRLHHLHLPANNISFPLPPSRGIGKTVQIGASLIKGLKLCSNNSLLDANFSQNVGHMRMISGSSAKLGQNSLEYGALICGDDPVLQFMLLQELYKNGKFYEFDFFLKLFRQPKLYPNSYNFFSPEQLPLELFPKYLQVSKKPNFPLESLSSERQDHRKGLFGTNSFRVYHQMSFNNIIYVRNEFALVQCLLYFRIICHIRGIKTPYLDGIYHLLCDLHGVIKDECGIDRANRFFKLQCEYFSAPNNQKPTPTSSNPYSGSQLDQVIPLTPASIARLYQYDHLGTNLQDISSAKNKPNPPQTSKIFLNPDNTSKINQYSTLLESIYHLTFESTLNWSLPITPDYLIVGFDVEFPSFSPPPPVPPQNYTPSSSTPSIPSSSSPTQLPPNSAAISRTSPHVSLFQITIGDFTFVIPTWLIDPNQIIYLTQSVKNDPRTDGTYCFNCIDRFMIFHAVFNTVITSPQIMIAGLQVGFDVQLGCETLNRISETANIANQYWGFGAGLTPDSFESSGKAQNDGQTQTHSTKSTTTPDEPKGYASLPPSPYPVLPPFPSVSETDVVNRYQYLVPMSVLNSRLFYPYGLSSSFKLINRDDDGDFEPTTQLIKELDNFFLHLALPRLKQTANNTINSYYNTIDSTKMSYNNLFTPFQISLQSANTIIDISQVLHPWGTKLLHYYQKWLESPESITYTASEWKKMEDNRAKSVKEVFNPDVGVKETNNQNNHQNKDQTTNQNNNQNANSQNDNPSNNKPLNDSQTPAPPEYDDTIDVLEALISSPSLEYNIRLDSKDTLQQIAGLKVDSNSVVSKDIISRYCHPRLRKDITRSKHVCGYSTPPNHKLDQQFLHKMRQQRIDLELKQEQDKVELCDKLRNTNQCVNRNDDSIGKFNPMRLLREKSLPNFVEMQQINKAYPYYPIACVLHNLNLSKNISMKNGRASPIIKLTHENYNQQLQSAQNCSLNNSNDSLTPNSTQNTNSQTDPHFEKLSQAISMFKRASFPNSHSLAYWVSITFAPLTLFKSPITCSNWNSFPLTLEKLHYAALDAAVCLQLLQHNYQRCIINEGFLTPQEARSVMLSTLSKTNLGQILDAQNVGIDEDEDGDIDGEVGQQNKGLGTNIKENNANKDSNSNQILPTCAILDDNGYIIRQVTTSAIHFVSEVDFDDQDAIIA